MPPKLDPSIGKKQRVTFGKPELTKQEKKIKQGQKNIRTLTETPVVEKKAGAKDKAGRPVRRQIKVSKRKDEKTGDIILSQTMGEVFTLAQRPIGSIGITTTGSGNIPMGYMYSSPTPIKQTFPKEGASRISSTMGKDGFDPRFMFKTTGGEWIDRETGMNVYQVPKFDYSKQGSGGRLY